MPRAFTKTERERIHDKLVDAGRLCFTRYGLKKTTIEDLVKLAGIAKSSFYLFFDSKEALYVELVMAEMPAMMQRLIARSFAATDDAREALVLLQREIVNEIETNEFARILLDDPGQIRQLSTTIDVDDVMKQSQSDLDPLMQAIAKAQERGEIIAGDLEQIMYALGLIKLIPLSKDRLPKAMYDSLLEFAPQVIANGLTCPARRQEEKR